ncbi:hypothetical protein EUTSA_v10001016mg [Eutrema salsugineum]|uniref:Plastid movement impaired protein n=1 Tax=Eutrema salsugineum TaxID=72664 RepID=V4N3V6_EUTSA|nr:uncharacterized protein At1g66480 [Eutrema salsugineum]ESQ39976.1 hypothetical protein EUTSA_v10001016mg [Eutrema salsugineum]
MGNSLGGKKTTKIMKIDGETFKLKTPVTAEEVLKDFPPGHVLLDSESVKHYGARAKPLEAKQRLEANRLYFVVDEPVKECPPRRVRSGIQMSAKERLENLMLARRSSSDLSILKPAGGWTTEEKEGGAVRVKLRIPKAELQRLIKEGATEAEATQKIAALFMDKQRHEEARRNTLRLGGHGGDELAATTAKPSAAATKGVKSRLKRVSFMAEREGGSEITVA